MRWIWLGLLMGCGDVVVDLGRDPGPRPIPTDPSVEPAARLVALPMACLAPSRDLLGFDRRTTEVDGVGVGMVGGALFAADLDGDSAIDLTTSDVDRSTAFLNLGGQFALDGCFFGFDLSDAASASPVDFDADGDLDVFVARWNRPQVLLRNESDRGSLMFTDATAAAGLGDVGAGLASTWADVDQDGDLDLFVSGHSGAPQRLYENLGGTFADVSHRLPAEAQQGEVTSAAWFDPDRDGIPDLYLVRSLGDHQGNLLIRNDGDWGLEPDGNELGLDVVADGTGLAIGDVNGDQIPDLLIGERGGLQLRLSRGGWWEEVSHELGLRPVGDQIDAWGVALGDVDNDGDLDAAIRFGPDELGDPVPRQPDALFVQQEDGSFVDVAPELGVDGDGVGRGLLMVDANDDGWLDLVGRDLDGPSTLDLSRCGTARSLRLELAQPGPNPHGVGALIRVVVGTRVWVRTVRAGADGFASAGPPAVHIGLGDLDQVDRVDVIWPDGRRNRFEDVSTGQRLQVQRVE